MAEQMKQQTEAERQKMREQERRKREAVNDSTYKKRITYSKPSFISKMTATVNMSLQSEIMQDFEDAL